MASVARGAVRLGAPNGVRIVGEGIETCLAVMLATGNPAWAALSTVGLHTVDLPDTCAKLSRSCWLAQRFFEATQGGAEFGGSAIGAECFEATGNSTPERTIISAPLGLDDRSYFDLGDKSWGAVEIDTSG